MDKPIIYSAEMVKAILNNQKNMTRRLNGLEKFNAQPDRWRKEGNIMALDGGFEYVPVPKPPWQPGDRLWVKETTWISECKRYLAQGLYDDHSSHYDIVDLETGKRYIWQHDRRDYALTDGMVTSWSWAGRYLRSGRQTEDFDVGFADVDTTIEIIPYSGNIILKKYEAQFRKKLSSRFMPKVAARIWLEVVNVRLERLQEIRENDAKAEGVAPHPNPHMYYPYCEVFVTLWDSLNEKRGYGWDVNPWVWVIEFKPVKAVAEKGEMAC